MALLILFGFLAGAGTALSPCVLPILPVVLSAGATGGRRRPLGIVIGLAVSFTFAAVALVYIISALGLPDDLLRYVAIVVLIGFGLALMLPKVSARLEGYLSRFTGRVKPINKGDGFGSGFLLGLTLGFVYTPCAGPVLAGVITVSASQDFETGRLLVALAYGIGSAVVLYVLMLGGRRLTGKLSSHSGTFQAVMGAVMILVGVGMAFNLDTRFQTSIASELPSWLVNPTKEIEESDSVKDDLADVRGGGKARQSSSTKTSNLEVIGDAPEFVGNQEWFNTPGGKPLTLKELRGKVVLVDFWTYSCINCLRTLPYIKAWDKRYRDKGLVVVGVHAPEFPFEKSASNVKDAIKQNGLKYPVVQDNELSTWNAYENQYWPAKYLIDARGRIRFTHFGEGEYDKTEKAIRSLLAEAGRSSLGSRSHVKGEAVTKSLTTPETYLGSERAQGFINGEIEPGTHAYTANFEKLHLNELAYRGTWKIEPLMATAGRGAALALDFQARKVFLVLGSPGKARELRVLLNGKPIPDRLAGPDVHNGTAEISSQRLYRLVDLGKAGGATLTLLPEKGIHGYAFTFG